MDCPELTVLQMGPGNARDSTEPNGNVHSVGKGKGKTKISRNPSNASLRELTQEDVDVGISAVRQISRILYFVNAYHEEISDIESIHGVGIRQQTRIDELEASLFDLTLRKDQEMARLQDENDKFRADAHQFEQEREELKREQASMDDTRREMQSEMQRQKDEEINEAKQQFSDRYKAKVKQTREELEKRMAALETEKKGLEATIKTFEEKNIQAQQDLNQQREGFEIDRRSSQSHIKRLESELRQINALSTVSPQKPEF